MGSFQLRILYDSVDVCMLSRCTLVFHLSECALLLTLENNVYEKFILEVFMMKLMKLCCSLFTNKSRADSVRSLRPYSSYAYFSVFTSGIAANDCS